MMKASRRRLSGISKTRSGWTILLLESMRSIMSLCTQIDKIAVAGTGCEINYLAEKLFFYSIIKFRWNL